VGINLEFVNGEITMWNGMNAAFIQISPEMIHEWGWFLSFGIVLALLGIVAVARSSAYTVTSMIFFGWLLLCAGAVEFAGALMVGRWTGFFLHLLAAILLLVTGSLVLIRRAINPEVATLVMSMFFLIGGLYQVVASCVFPLPGWGWQVFSGVFASFMGVALLIDWPCSGLSAIGVFIGIDLILSGCSWGALAADLGKM
jgi:uncharacterized membrane protein HdeD (DUF308 family)